jgi:adenosine deaminase
MVRASVEHSFLPGPSLWENSKASGGDGVRRRSAGRKALGGQKVLDASEKARMQWKVEEGFENFERRF